MLLQAPFSGCIVFVWEICGIAAPSILVPMYSSLFFPVVMRIKFSLRWQLLVTILKPWTGLEHRYFAGALNTSSIWRVGLRKKQGELRWKLSVKGCPAKLSGSSNYSTGWVNLALKGFPLKGSKSAVDGITNTVLRRVSGCRACSCNHAQSLERISVSVVIWAVTNLHKFLSCLKS